MPASACLFSLESGVALLCVLSFHLFWTSDYTFRFIPWSVKTTPIQQSQTTATYDTNTRVKLTIVTVLPISKGLAIANLSFNNQVLTVLASSQRGMYDSCLERV